MLDASKSLGARKPCLLVATSTYPRWAGDPEPGFVHELSRRLTDHFRVIVVTPHAPGALVRENLDGVEVLRFRYAPTRFETLVNDGGILGNLKNNPWKWLLLPGFVLSQATMIQRACRREEVDLIHAHWLVPQGMITALLQTLPGRKTPFVVTSHGSDIKALHGHAMDALRRFVVRRCEAITVVSDALLDSLRAMGADASKANRMPMGVDLTEKFIPDTSIRRSNNQILFVGRLVENKGIEHLLDAMPIVLQTVPEARLTVAGFGPLEALLKKQCGTLGIDASVEFLGPVPQARLPDLYRSASIFVAPFGKEEGLGLVLVEAIGCGCPVLTSDIPAARDIFGEYYDRHVIPSTDRTTLSARIIEALQVPNGPAAPSPQLEKHVMESFSWDRVAESYTGLLIRHIPSRPSK